MNSGSPTLLRIRHDAQETEVPELLRRELQTVKILSIAVMSDHAIVEIAPATRRKSAILRHEWISGVPMTVVDDHAALLPVWLGQALGAKRLLYIHVDHHSDLGMPNLFQSGGRLLDRFSGQEVNPSDLASVVFAVDSTAIEIGSFLTLALAWLSPEALVWLHPPGVEPATRAVGLHLGWDGVDPLSSSDRRLKAMPVFGGDFQVALRVTSMLEGLASVIAADDGRDIILDIDLDYFDNSYAALDQAKPMPAGNLPGADWLTRQASVLSALFGMIPAGRLRSVGIARSPGFCPPRVADALVELVRAELIRWLRGHP
jgi:hypothetical protein